MIILYNNGITPLLPEQGSLGASGDLIPLAHSALMLLGEGNVYDNGKIKKVADVLKKLGMKKHSFLPKEALSLINGTEVTTSRGAFALSGSRTLIYSAVRTTAALFEVLGASKSCLDERIHDLKPHAGQKIVAGLLRKHLSGSKLCDNSRKVQDSYVIRCAPQIDRAIFGRIEDAVKTIETEMNSVTDNPLFFYKKNEAQAVSGGNFHAQSAAFALDSLGIALVAFGRVSERRI